MSSQKYIKKPSSKLQKVKRRVRKCHFEDNSCLRVIAEKIVTWKYAKLSDECQALKFTISSLKEEGENWSRGQIRRALKYCYDPRHYRREAMKEVYELAGVEVDHLPQVPKWWAGITEWCYPKNDEDEDSENWHARRERIGSEELSDKKYEYLRGREK